MTIKWDRDGLIPAIIQHAESREVLMLGYMNEEAYQNTLEAKKITFFSRSKQRLWTKGETSGNFLNLVSVKNDCDADALLFQVIPEGPTCHKNTDTCWGDVSRTNFGVLERLEAIISDRQTNGNEKSYVADLFRRGINKIAQKVGEEAVETVIEAMDTNDELFLEESADLLFHYLILLRAKGFGLTDVMEILKSREKR